jgi:hypothetical protein
MDAAAMTMPEAVYKSVELVVTAAICLLILAWGVRNL